jgi:hypothetical protein
VSLYDPLAYRQTYSGAGVLLPAAKPLEEDENALRILRGDADPVVAYGKRPPVAIAAGGDVDARWFASPKFDGIPDQVLKQLD